MDRYTKFKHLLEYFVSHLEWVVNHDTSHPGYDVYISPIKNFKKSGQGWNNNRIQEQIKPWAEYDGDTLCINVFSANYQSNACYLNWKGTWDNVRPLWNGKHIVSLYLTQEECAGAREEQTCSVAALGLFDGAAPNERLKEFFDDFLFMHMGIEETAAECVKLLRSNRNLILTGAPGTGKTYLAKEIARAMGAATDNGQCEMVQFHPSYDYTDFVEGLRPVGPDDNGNIGFERKDGVFKAFCKRAIKSGIVNTVDNFDECWDRLIDMLNNQDYLDIPLLSGKQSFRVELNVTGDGLANRAYEDDDSGKNTWIQGKSKFFNKEQLYRIYKGLPGIPSRGHDNYRKAIVQYMKGSLGLKNYYKGSSDENNSRQAFIFIIDEINRGEISKIFGELFFSIDPGYRGQKDRVPTQYQNLITDETDPFYNGFYIPENVYVIGTMNDIDRSVESMDFAMRRRFAWKEIKAGANTGMLDGLREMKNEVVGVMERLNSAIWNEDTDTGVEGLSAAYHIGGSYFCKLQLYLNENRTNKEDAYVQLWETHLKGVLFEYLRGTADAMDNLKLLEQAYYNGK